MPGLLGRRHDGQGLLDAARVRREAGENLEAQVTHAFRLATAHDPNPRELATLTALAKNHNLDC